MSIPNNYNAILNVFNNVGPSKITPVTNMAEFNYNVYAYYNQYCASAKVTQDRRILRNYYNNQQSIKQSNINPFKNNKNKIYSFLYTYQQNYMIIQDKNKNLYNVYINIKGSWCHMKTFTNENDCILFQNFIKSYALK